MNINYYSFGMQMRGERGVTHGYDAVDYRYAFQGMEQDNEVSDNGNSYTTEFRQYDPRLGRWKSLDPLMHMFPSMSPYVAFDNNPIYYTDIYGLSSDGPGDPPKNNGSEAGGEVSDDGCWEYHCDSDYANLDGWVSTETGKYNNSGQNLLSNAVQTLSQLESLGARMAKLDAEIKRNEQDFQSRMQALDNDFPSGGPSTITTYEDKEETIFYQRSENTTLVYAIPIAGAITQADSPVPGPADVVAGVFLAGAIVYSAVAGEQMVTTSLQHTTTTVKKADQQYYYVTYTMTNIVTGQVYVGRSSGYGDPQSIVNNRMSNHHKLLEGYEMGVLDIAIPSAMDFGTRYNDPSYYAIRGVEQLRIEGYREQGVSGNAINGIGPNNVRGKAYIQAAKALLGL